MTYPETQVHHGGALKWILPLIFGLLLGILASRMWTTGQNTGPIEPRAVTPRGDLTELEQTTIDLFRENGPSVVFITTIRRARDFWGLSEIEIPRGTGSGVIWDQGGWVVTNFHVIEGAARARVTLWDRSTYDAEIVGRAPAYDLALLRIKAPPDKLRPIPVGSSADLQVGQLVFAIGNPFGLDQTLTTGVVSAVGRTIRARTGRPIEDVIQTDAAINPGNSGGPLLDSAGRLIGLSTAIVSPSGAFAGIGFAVPVDTLNRVIPQLVERGEVIRPYLGVFVNDPVSRQITARIGVEGLLILGVEPNGPADRAGLRPTTETEDGQLVLGDVILSIEGRQVRTVDDLFAALERHNAGDQITLRVHRDGEEIEVPVTLQAPPNGR